MSEEPDPVATAPVGVDEGLFGSGSVTWRMHVELVMWIGGLRALYLQSLHPRVMRGTFQNSALFDRRKAWARFLRTAQFVTVRTYGTTDEAERAGARVRGIHSRLTGFDPDTGETFRLDEPAGLLWVHCAEVDSYLDVAMRAGVVDDADADRYVAEARRAAALIGIDPADAPGDRAELRAYFDRMRGGLYACEEARRGLRQSFNPPLPTRLALLRVGVPSANLLALSCLPAWARRMFGFPVLPGADATATVQLRAVRLAGRLIRRESTERLIADARTAAAQMAAGTFRSALSGR